MKKHLLSIIVLCLIVLAACAAQKKTSSGNGITYIKMLRTPCFGKCPNYTVEIFSDGRVRYSGIRFTDNLGVYEKNIGAGSVKKIFQDFQEYRVDTCSSEYRLMISDVPGLNYTITYGKKTQEIRNAHFGPRFLKDLGKEVDAAIHVDKTWKKIGVSTGQE